MKAVRFLTLIFLLFLLSCTRHPAPGEPSPPSGKEKEPARMGYTVQVGAFSRVENAARLTTALKRRGIDAYYFVFKSGIYKVRFGNYPTEGRARERAGRLRNEGIIEEFFIVRPEQYVIAKRAEKGDAYIRDELERTARSFIGVPYLWGGGSADEGFDCSGFTMAVYQYNGLMIPHSSAEQSAMGVPVSRGDLEKGDLVFFKTNSAGNVSHVGVYIGGGRFIHAPGRGKRIGVESLETPYYVKHYAGGRSLL